MAIRSIAILVVLGVSHHAAAFSCYSCTSSVNATNVESTSNSCVDVSGQTAVDAGQNACKTVFTTGDGTGFTITRDIAYGMPATTTGSYCTTTDSQTTCYCSSDKCNSQRASADRSYSCYTCSSSEYFDNGCGATLNSGSEYVKTTVGCSACYKNVYVDGDMTVRYKRGCSRGIQVDDSCYGDVYYSSTRQCACKKNLCNSAESHVIKFSTATATVLLSAFFKYFY